MGRREVIGKDIQVIENLKEGEERSFQCSGVEEELAQLYRSQVAWCHNELLIVVIIVIKN